nr:hypothetical protein [Tanacetum cinerariifolium]
MPKVLSRVWEKFFEIQHAQPEDTHELFRNLLEDLQIISEELAEYINSPSWNRPTLYNDDDEYSIQYKEYLENSSNAIAPVLPTEEPEYSLSMGDKHFSTILETESDEGIKSSVENLVPIPSDFEVFFNDEKIFKIYLNPLFDDEEIISTKIDLHFFNAESDLIESLLNQDTLIDSIPKFNFLLEEFFGELAHIDPILPGIKEADFDLEEEICLVENLLYDNSSPQSPEELNAEIADTIIESLSISYPRIESADYDSKGDIYFLEELLSNDTFPRSEKKSSNFDHHDDSSFPHPPPEPPDVDIFFDLEPDTVVLTANMMEDISEHYVLMPNLFPTHPPFDKAISNFFVSPMMMYGGEILFLDVPYLHFYPP